MELSAICVFFGGVNSFLHLVCKARAGLWPAHTWFLEIAFIHNVDMCLCSPRGYKLHSCNIEPVQLVEQVRNISMHGHGLCNEASCDRNQPNKAMLAP